METFKFTTQYLLIYTAMLMYLLAFVAIVLRYRKLSHGFYVAGFLAATVAFIYRWHHVGHVPMQNLFEVFLTMGAMIYPLTVFCRQALRVGSGSMDMLMGVLVLFPAGFIFDGHPRQLPPALQCWLFAPHVAVYMFSYIIMAKAAVQAFCQLLFKNDLRDPQLVSYEEGTYRIICLGFPLLSLGLFLGSWWGKLAWGDFWGWDPKELWSLATWLIYLCYFHFRYMYGRKYARINSLWAILGMTAVIITLLWVNLAASFSGLHSYA